MKKVLFCLSLLTGFIVQAQVYNNEWISDFNKTYYKFKVGKTGLYRIQQPTLAIAGLSGTPAQHFQLFRNGREIPIYISAASGTLSSSDYIEFWGVMNDGKPDKELYRLPNYAKIIHRSVGSFAKAWGFGLDAGLQIQAKKWKFGFAGRDITTTFNSWSFNFTEKEKEALYLTNNDIPVKSTEMTAPRLIAGVARDFRLGKKVGLLAEANLDFTFDGQRNTLISADPVSIDPKLGLEANINNVVFIRGGINNFQRALADKDTVNQTKVWIYQPSLGAGFRLQNVRIDYAFTNLANQSSSLYTHVFSLQLDLVNDKKRKSTK
jgi:hypothetical protein